ncbi:flagellar protein FlgN [Shewanella sp. C32]|uniref:Flagellar protein FlgN n=1 Tax=Shewanella electrica TaxID=515560 RepID=A0ABT2FJD3_9GAMM|nr:flagellar protein FlgN [Shewanella electrica]MCH1924544.1 flagellar protein FlgN [Shewanella electrica]MCS4556445.1 flagellar protein FlgN [Shewanella electrica]
MQLSDLEQHLNKQTLNLERLLFLIDQEKHALISRDADKLLSLAADKSKMLEAIKEVDAQLAQHPNKDDFSREPLAALVADAKALMTECQTKNQENGKLIELCNASINRLAQALQMSRNSSSLTYDGKGKTSTISTLGNDLKA